MIIRRQRLGRQRHDLFVVSLFLTFCASTQVARADGAEVEQGADFGPQAHTLWRAFACGADEPLPAILPAKRIQADCKELSWIYGRFHKKWESAAAPFFSTIRPHGLPSRVIYPFGGGDLLFALVVYPDASEITNVSLERADNVRVVDNIRRSGLLAGIDNTIFMIKRLVGVDYSFTAHMAAMQRAALPVQIAMALAALAAHRYEPVSLRYFTVADDGSLHYLSLAELDGGQHPGAYDNVEISFRKQGDPDAPIKTYRSIAGNLHDNKFERDRGLGRYLAGQAPFAAIIKAASYLIWRDDFSKIRDVLLSGMVYMVSDSTGILPMHSQAAGFTLTAYGDFKGSLLGTQKEQNRNMRDLWRSQQKRPLGFRFGYPDCRKKGGHLLVTAKPQVTSH
jgi:hypothetical protein